MGNIFSGKKRDKIQSGISFAQYKNSGKKLDYEEKLKKLRFECD